MKMKLISTALLASLMSAGTYAASTGTITFTGELTDTTCEVDINGNGSDATVTLPSEGIENLTTAGAVSGRTSFNMNLSKCAAGKNNPRSKVATFFQAGSTVDLSTGRLINQSTAGATNVALQLLDPANNFEVINVGNTDQIAGSTYVDIDATNGTALLHYAVEYYALGQTTPGAVSSSVIYNLMYK
ncbi:fimbrial protein [Providencia rettgeri]|uniref:fimbrial protein n=1 Tax=Providencia rettgeri TaxID=587 RepID=UPI001B35E7CB|nr:fimbrial protein [Providencia rettgeri]MBQ0368832.1 type 1 fimbrial protein [Providencia rettgeri]